jgi:ribonuclease R
LLESAVPLSETEVLAAFERAGGRPVKLRDLARDLGVRRRDLPELRDLVRRLEAAGKLRRGPNRRYQRPVQSSDVVVGRLQGVRAGFAFILRDAAPDVYVRPENLGLAVHGDVVMARLRRHRGRLEGIVERVVQPARKLLAGTLQFDASGWFLVPDEERITRDVNLSASAIQPLSRQQGHKALVRLQSASRDAELHGEIVTILGPPDQPGVRTQALLAEFDLPEGFEDAVLASVEDVRPPEAAACAGREDLSQLLAFTIDPLDAKDHDDAVSLVRTPGGGFELGVHIADVSFYVAPDSLADQEAERRGTSVYMADRVVPMLPEILSNHVCSLRPGVPRLALSALLQFDAEGRPRGGRLSESWIASRVKLSYQAAETLLAGDEPPPEHLATHSGEESGETPWSGRQPWPAVRAAVQAALADMRHLARLLRARRMAAGSLDIDTPEYRVLHDARGRVTSIEERERLESYQVIEEFMLAANQFVARALAAGRQPLLWRVHETPAGAKADELRLFMKKLGIGWSCGDPPDNADYQRLLHAIERRPERRYLMYKVLRSLQKARYDARQQAHFGLSFSHYTHFTSPIRRYPDLYNHRLVRRLLRGRAALDPDPARHGPELDSLGAHTSARELLAAEAERASLKLKVCEFLVSQVGDIADGFVSSIADHGLYVDVPAWRTEGLVHASQLTDDDYRPDLHHTRLVGSRTRRTFQFGQPLRVQLVRADPDRRQIDLVLAH